MRRTVGFLVWIVVGMALGGCTSIAVDAAWIPPSEGDPLPLRGMYWAFDKGKRSGMIYITAAGTEFEGAHAVQLRMFLADKDMYGAISRFLVRGRQLNDREWAVQIGEGSEWTAAIVRRRPAGGMVVQFPNAGKARTWFERKPPRPLRAHVKWNEKKRTLRFDRHACTKLRDDVLAVVRHCCIDKLNEFRPARAEDVAAYLALRADDLPKLDAKPAAPKVAKGQVLAWLEGDGYACGRVFTFSKSMVRMATPGGTNVTKKRGEVMSLDDATLRGDPVLRDLFRRARAIAAKR